MGVQASAEVYPDYRISTPSRSIPYVTRSRTTSYRNLLSSDKLLRDAEIVDQLNRRMEHNCGDDECNNCGGLMSTPYSGMSGGGQKHCLSCNYVVCI